MLVFECECECAIRSGVIDRVICAYFVEFARGGEVVEVEEEEVFWMIGGVEAGRWYGLPAAVVAAAAAATIAERFGGVNERKPACVRGGEGGMMRLPPGTCPLLTIGAECVVEWEVEFPPTGKTGP